MIRCLVLFLNIVLLFGLINSLRIRKQQPGVQQPGVQQPGVQQPLLGNVLQPGVQQPLLGNVVGVAHGIPTTRISLGETDRQAASRAALGNGMQDLHNVLKNDPFSKLGVEGDSHIESHPKLLEESSGVIVFDLPKEGDEEVKKARERKRGMDDLEKGKDTSCGQEAIGATEEVEASSIENMDPANIEEMLRTMTLQERMAFDAEEQQKLESESTKLKGEMMDLLYKKNHHLEAAAAEKTEVAEVAEKKKGAAEEEEEEEV